MARSPWYPLLTARLLGAAIVAALGGALAAPLAAEQVTLNVRFRYDGTIGPMAYPASPECRATPGQSTDLYEGELSGDESEIRSEGQVVYSGVVQRTTNLTVCDVGPEDADGVAKVCSSRLVGGGDYQAELTVYADRTEVYFQTEPLPGRARGSASGNCEPELTADLARVYLLEGDGFEHWIGPKVYGPRDRVGGPLRPGHYPEPPPHDPVYQVGSWTMDVGPADELRADAGGPYRVERGQRVRLDGSRSTGQIQNYTWTLTAQPCPEYQDLLGRTTPSIRTKEGVTLELVALCPFKARLRISDGSGFEEDEELVEIVPREWATKTGKPEKSVYTGNYLLWPCLFCQWGKNLCAEEHPPRVEDVGHQIHHPIGSSTWEGGPKGYELRPVRDPGMLFDGWWYVADQKLEMTRAELVHADLAPGGCIATRNTAGDFATLRAAVAEHEHQHTLDLETELDKIDPARTIEGFVASPRERDVLREATDRCIGIADAALGERVPKDDAVHAAMLGMARFATNGRIFLPTSAPVSNDPAECGELEFRSYDIPSYAGMGHSTSSNR